MGEFDKDQSTFSFGPLLSSCHNVSLSGLEKIDVDHSWELKGSMFLPMGYSWFVPKLQGSHVGFFRRICMKMSLVPCGKRRFILVSRHGRCEVRRSANKRYPQQSVKFILE